MSPPLLPGPLDDDALSALLEDDPDRFRAAVLVVAARHALDATRLRFCPDGSRPVFAADPGWVVKLFPPGEETHQQVELDALSFLADRIDVPAPAPIAEGELEGWRYLVMSRVPGVPLSDLRRQLSRDELDALMGQTGELLAQLHDLDVDDLPWDPGGWTGFVAAQRRRCVEEQRRLGLEGAWLAQIPSFVDRYLQPDDDTPVFLHTEVMEQHLFAERRQGRWRLSGIIDLEPAMLGAPGYEFAAVGIFVTRGDPQHLRTLLHAYGYTAQDLTSELQRRFMAWTLLHRYAHLPWFLQRMPPGPGIESLEALAGRWWAF